MEMNHQPDAAMQQTAMQKAAEQKAAERLVDLLRASVSPFHASAAAAEKLKEAGYTALDRGEDWRGRIEKGGKYFTVCFGTTLIAFTVGHEFSPSKPNSLRAAAAHIDWPGLRIKPSPEQVSAGCCKLNIEPYGAMIFSSWIDRPLSAAGTVNYLDENGRARCVGVDFEQPILTVPGVAIHLNREINRGVEMKANTDMLPLLATAADGWSRDGYFLSLLSEKTGIAQKDILSFDLCVYNAEQPALIGPRGEFLSSPRLDNITSVSACIDALTKAGEGQENGLNAIVLYDHEEIGSKTKQGADSVNLTLLFEKLAIALGLDRVQYIDLMMGGTLLSCDVAHAVHPNHPEYADPTCQALLGRGAVIKMNNNQRYPTDAGGVGEIAAICRKENIPYQLFMNRADLAGGGTIGAYASSQLGMMTVDCGVPLLSMHSARELMAARDQTALSDLVTAFLRR